MVVETFMLERTGGSDRASVGSHTAVGTGCGASLVRSAGSSGRGPRCRSRHQNVPIGHGLWSSRSSNHSWETAQSLGDSEHVTEAAPDDAAVTDRFKRELPSSGSYETRSHAELRVMVAALEPVRCGRASSRSALLRAIE